MKVGHYPSETAVKGPSTEAPATLKVRTKTSAAEKQANYDRFTDAILKYSPAKAKAETTANPSVLRSAEMFSGCGGLALGMSRAGFQHAVMAELDSSAVETAQHNKKRGLEHIKAWPVEKTDVREIDWSALAGKLAVVSGGPPCQPFGIGGKKQGHRANRPVYLP